MYVQIKLDFKVVAFKKFVIKLILSVNVNQISNVKTNKLIIVIKLRIIKKLYQKEIYNLDFKYNLFAWHCIWMIYYKN